MRSVTSRKKHVLYRNVNTCCFQKTSSRTCPVIRHIHLAFIYAPSNELVFFNPLIIRCVSGATLCPSCEGQRDSCGQSRLRRFFLRRGNCTYMYIWTSKLSYLSSYYTPLLHGTIFGVSILNASKSTTLHAIV